MGKELSSKRKKKKNKTRQNEESGMEGEQAE